MNKSNKIGVGVITCDRPAFFKKCVESLPVYIDRLVVVDDGETKVDVPKEVYDKFSDVVVIKNASNKQVGECKNIAMRDLIDSQCDYIFTLEDDIFIKDVDTFNKYIEASKETGIEHFNFGFSQKENLDKDLNPVYKKVIEYKNTKILLTPNILGAFTFYTRNCLQTIGLHHKRFNKGHGDHPELTYRAYKHGFTTPFWWFADLYESWNLIGNSSNLGSDIIQTMASEFHLITFEKAKGNIINLKWKKGK